MKIKNLFHHIKNKPWGLPLAGVIFTLLVTVISIWNRNPEKIEGTPAPEELDLGMLIPQGHVLIPIQIHNSETVDSVFGQYGFVDLYAIDPQGQPKRSPAIQSVKMVRAPKNPSQFGILVHESQAPKILSQGQSFAVVLLNSKNPGTRIERLAPHRKPIKRMIILEEEEKS